MAVVIKFIINSYPMRLKLYIQYKVFTFIIIIIIIIIRFKPLENPRIKPFEQANVRKVANKKPFFIIVFFFFPEFTYSQ